MPVSQEFAESNRIQTERMRRLVRGLEGDELAVTLPNGWTVAVAFAHMAIWDRQRLCLMRRWAAGAEAHGHYDGEVFNEALLPLLQMIPPEKAAHYAIAAAEEVDAFLLAVSDTVVLDALARPEKPNLNRGSHRGYHLDQVEQALGGAGYRLGG